jgi:formylglycine-generating enzyme required for sulfatase activity
MEYCRWLSKMTGKAYRLPTEAEWEWAARAGTTTTYFFGDDPAKLGEYAWIESNSEDHPKKVGLKKPNPWGLYDIYGNVSEWCLDHYDAKLYGTFSLDKPALQPVNLPVPERFPDVARGGAWSDQAAACRSAARRGSDNSWIKRDPQRPQSIWWLTDADFVGFRIVRAVDEQENLKGVRSTVTKKSK